MGLVNDFKNGLRYIENIKEADRIIKENKEILDSYRIRNLVVVPITERNDLNEAGIIEEKELECRKKTEIMEPLMIYLDGLTKEQKKKLPPLGFRVKINGPAEFNREYSIFKLYLIADSMSTYSQKLKEMGPEGRGRGLNIEYMTEDFDILDKNYFDHFFKITRMSEKDKSLSKNYFDAGLPLSYVHKIDHRPESVREFQNSIEGIQKEIWSTI